MIKDYCKTCTNVKTALCGLCAQVTTVKGESQKPSHYIGWNEDIFETSELRACDCAVIIENRAKRHQPIPLYYVIEYNRLIGGE